MGSGPCRARTSTPATSPWPRGGPTATVQNAELRKGSLSHSFRALKERKKNVKKERVTVVHSSFGGCGRVTSTTGFHWRSPSWPGPKARLSRRSPCPPHRLPASPADCGPRGGRRPRRGRTRAGAAAGPQGHSAHTAARGRPRERAGRAQTTRKHAAVRMRLPHPRRKLLAVRHVPGGVPGMS